MREWEAEMRNARFEVVLQARQCGRQGTGISPANAGERRRGGLVAGNGARLELQPLAFCCVSPTPQLKREQSLRPEFGWIRGNLQDFSKR
jgi:hypothetical protein